MLIDAAMIAGCIGAAFAWKYQDSETPENLIHVYLIPLSILLRWLFYGYFNLYDFSRQETLLDQIYYLFWCNCLASGIEWLGLLVAKAYYLGDAAGVSREMILTSWALILAASSLWRGVFFHARPPKRSTRKSSSSVEKRSSWRDTLSVKAVSRRHSCLSSGRWTRWSGRCESTGSTI
jgi:hypothetical protein